MTLLASSNGIPTLFYYAVTGDIDPSTYLDLSGKSVVHIGFSISNPSNTIVNAQVEFFGGSGPGTTAFMGTPVTVTGVEGAASASGNVVSFTNGLPSSFTTVTIVNPPNTLQIAFSASSFPSSPTSASVSCTVGWK